MHGASDDRERDYLFDLQGYLVLPGALAERDLAAMNRWLDDHWSYVLDPPSREGPRDQVRKGRWIGHVELHSYGPDDGVNFQNIVEGGAVFERLIDYPAWLPLVSRYVNSVNRLSIHENLLNVRTRGGFLYIHSGGHVPLSYFTFRQHNTGAWMVGQINVLMALNDIGPGDGPTVLVPGSHKASEVHPRLEVEGKPITSADHERQGAGNALGMREVHLRAGDVLLFTDAVTHGSAERTNPGYRRPVLYRYSPRHIRTRFNYQLSPALRERLTPERRAILEPVAPRSPLRDGRRASTRAGVGSPTTMRGKSACR